MPKAIKRKLQTTITKYKGLISKIKPDTNHEFILEKGKTYLFELQQKLNPALIRHHKIYGMATAKSSIGRLDVLARLIVDGMGCYEGFNHEVGGDVVMYVEITPLSFNIIMKVNTSITQLRLFLGEPDKCEIRSNLLHEASISDGTKDGYLRVDLTNSPVGSIEACAFRAKNEGGLEPIRAFKIKNIPMSDPKKYWDNLSAHENKSGEKYLIIEQSRFYILRSIEKIALHDTTAVYCMAIDETIGEMRIHYAGFVHPLFGRNKKAGEDQELGTPLIFEVRGHDVPVILQHREKLAKIKYYQMSRAAQKAEPTEYSNQKLKLSGFFDEWR